MTQTPSRLCQTCPFSRLEPGPVPEGYERVHKTTAFTVVVVMNIEAETAEGAAAAVAQIIPAAHSTTVYVAGSEEDPQEKAVLIAEMPEGRNRYFRERTRK